MSGNGYDLREDAVDGVGMDKGDLQAEEAAAWARRRSARRPRRRARRARRRRRRPRRRCDGRRARAWRGSGRPACRRRSARAARSGSRRRAPTAASTPWSGTSSRCSSVAAEQARVRRRRPRRGRRRRRRRDGCRWRPRRRCYFPPESTGGGRTASTSPYSTASTRRHEPVAVDVLHHRLDVAARVAADDLRHLPRRRGHLARRDLDVGRGAAEARAALVDHQLRVRQREALARRAARHDHRGGRHAHPEADRRDIGRTCCIAS